MCVFPAQSTIDKKKWFERFSGKFSMVIDKVVQTYIDSTLVDHTEKLQE